MKKKNQNEIEEEKKKEERVKKILGELKEIILEVCPEKKKKLSEDWLMDEIDLSMEEELIFIVLVEQKYSISLNDREWMSLCFYEELAEKIENKLTLQKSLSQEEKE